MKVKIQDHSGVVEYGRKAVISQEQMLYYLKQKIMIIALPLG